MAANVLPEKQVLGSPTLVTRPTKDLLVRAEGTKFVAGLRSCAYLRNDVKAIKWSPNGFHAAAWQSDIVRRSSLARLGRQRFEYASLYVHSGTLHSTGMLAVLVLSLKRQEISGQHPCNLRPDTRRPLPIFSPLRFQTQPTTITKPTFKVLSFAPIFTANMQPSTFLTILASASVAMGAAVANWKPTATTVYKTVTATATPTSAPVNQCKAGTQPSCCKGGLLGLDCLLIVGGDTCDGTVACCNTTQEGLINVDLSCILVDLFQLDKHSRMEEASSSMHKYSVPEMRPLGHTLSGRAFCKLYEVTTFLLVLTL
nr:hypothetical protein CFP56_20471 [Quercus suber]